MARVALVEGQTSYPLLRQVLFFQQLFTDPPLDATDATGLDSLFGGHEATYRAIS